MGNPQADPRRGNTVTSSGAAPIPLEVNTSAAYFEREREHIFRRHWLNVGHTSEVPNPGDYVLKRLPTLGGRGDPGAWPRR
ncbi:hypothetical protein [Immundisolibacter sp.]|uniref:hypothetical protein n=1 Tax=Immundisolibacter sp. TaxID=1934948 RepID=UPI00356A206F